MKLIKGLLGSLLFIALYVALIDPALGFAILVWAMLFNLIFVFLEA
jgi:hypothetical protein